MEEGAFSEHVSFVSNFYSSRRAEAEAQAAAAEQPATAEKVEALVGEALGKAGAEETEKGAFYRQQQERLCLSHTLAILKKIWLIEELDAGTQALLTDVATYLQVPKGTVLFQQGDMPGDCYVILSGEVVVLRKPTESDAAGTTNLEYTGGDDVVDNSLFPRGAWNPMDLEDSRSPSKQARSASKQSSDKRRGSKSHADLEKAASSLSRGRRGSKDSRVAGGDEAARRRSIVPVPVPVASEVGSSEGASGDKEDEDPGVPTVEGFSCVKKDACLGCPVATMGACRIFGEVALVNKQPRNATIRCEEDTEFLLVKQKDFDRILKAEIARLKNAKFTFLQEHVPGIREMGERWLETHGYFFKKATYAKGHMYFEEGSPPNQSLFSVIRGEVEVRKREAPSWGHACSAAHHRVPFRRLGVLVGGGCFGTAAHAGDTEPFSIVAISSCEVYQLTGLDVQRLPRAFTDLLSKYLVDAAKWRRQRWESMSTPLLEPEGHRGRRASDSTGIHLMRPSSSPNLSMLLPSAAGRRQSTIGMAAGKNMLSPHSPLRSPARPRRRSAVDMP